jgi:hypothetical protein
MAILCEIPLGMLATGVMSKKLKKQTPVQVSNIGKHN